MDPDVAFHLEIAAVVTVALLIDAVTIVASGSACEGDGYVAASTTGRAAVDAVDVESALGNMTLLTYEQAKEEERCAMRQSEYGQDGELVRVVPACGHFFHARCDARSAAAGSGRTRCRGCHGGMHW